MTTVPDPRNPVQAPRFVGTVHAVAQKAQEALPLANGRIEKAVEIVLSGAITLQADAQAGGYAALVCNPNWRLRREL